MTPGSHAGRSGIHGTPIGLRSVAHRSRSVIHRSRHHADIRKSDIIKRHIVLDIRPFHLFHTEHAFKINDMRIGTVDTCRFVNAVQIKGQFISGRHLSDAIHHFNGSLIITIQEIHLKTFDSHIRIFLTSCFQLAVEYIKHRPKHYFYPFGFAVCYQLRQIKFGNNRKHIPAFRIIPAFVQNNELDAVPAGKINVIFIGVHVNARLKRNPFQIPVVPPVPRHFPCLDPRSITDTVGRSQGIDQVVDRHIRILFSNGQHTPRIGTGATATGYKIGGFGYIFLLPPRIKVCFSRIRSKDTFQSILSLL